MANLLPGVSVPQVGTDTACVARAGSKTRPLSRSPCPEVNQPMGRGCPDRRACAAHRDQDIHAGRRNVGCARRLGMAKWPLRSGSVCGVSVPRAGTDTACVARAGSRTRPLSRSPCPEVNQPMGRGCPDRRARAAHWDQDSHAGRGNLGCARLVEMAKWLLRSGSVCGVSVPQAGHAPRASRTITLSKTKARGRPTAQAARGRAHGDRGMAIEKTQKQAEIEALWACSKVFPKGRW